MSTAVGAMAGKTVKVPRAISRRRLRTLADAIDRASAIGDVAKVKHIQAVRSLQPKATS